MGGRSHLAGDERPALGAAARDGEAPVSVVPLLLRRASGCRRAALPGLRQVRQPARFTGRSGIQPAMVRAHSTACALSVTPGNRGRSSMAATK